MSWTLAFVMSKRWAWDMLNLFLHSFLIASNSGYTMSHMPQAITMLKQIKITMHSRCSLIVHFSSRISCFALCRSAYILFHCAAECSYSSHMLCLMETRSWITLFALPSKCPSIQYLKSQGCSTCAHARNLLPVSGPDQQQHKIGENPCRHVSPVLTSIPSECCSSSVSSYTKSTNFYQKSNQSPIQINPSPNANSSVLTSTARAASWALELDAPGNGATPLIGVDLLPLLSLDPCSMGIQAQRSPPPQWSEQMGERWS